MGSSAACTEGEANCPANYEGEESGLAQIKAHTAKKTSVCIGEIVYNHADSHGTDLDPGCAKANAHAADAGCFAYTDNPPKGPWLACKERCKENAACKSWTL